MFSLCFLCYFLQLNRAEWTTEAWIFSHGNWQKEAFYILLQFIKLKYEALTSRNQLLCFGLAGSVGISVQLEGGEKRNCLKGDLCGLGFLAIAWYNTVSTLNLKQLNMSWTGAMKNISAKKIFSVISQLADGKCNRKPIAAEILSGVNTRYIWGSGGISNRKVIGS